MSKVRRQYSAEFKREAVALLRSSGKKATEIEHDMGIGDGCLLRWKQAEERAGEDAFPGVGHQTPELERLRQLERENEVLRQERDILKKAVAIFSHPNR
jgi:transposase